MYSTPTAQEIVNWVTTADGCVHADYTTQLDFALGKFVQTRRNYRFAPSPISAPWLRLYAGAERSRRRNG